MVGVDPDGGGADRDVERLRALFETSRDLLAILEASRDPRGNVTDWVYRKVNARLVETLGLSREQVEGRPLSAVAPQTLARVRDAWSGVLTTGDPSSAQQTFGDRYFQVRCSRLDRDAIAVVAVDVTEDTRRKMSLAQANGLAAVGTLAAGAAHEINSPLAAVLAGLDHLAAALSTDPERSPLLPIVAEARAGAARVREVSRTLGSFARVEGRAWVDLQALLEDSLRIVGGELLDRARLVRTYEAVPTILANEAQLGQVFVTLLLHAARSRPAGRAQDNVVEVLTATGRDGSAVVQVRDSGPGLTEEQAARLFHPFAVDKLHEEAIGLPLCQSIVTSLGGEIVVDGRPGIGTTFRLRFPVSSEPPAEEDAERSVESDRAPESRRGRVLVVDDEVAIGRAIVRLVGGEHEVVAIPKAQEALERLVAGERFDVVFCDLMMPEMTGMALYARIEELAPDQAERFVFLTGGAFTPEARAFLDRVANRTLDKPFDSTVIRRTVADMVARGERPSSSRRS